MWNAVTKAFRGENGVLKEIEIVNAEWEISPEGRPLRFTEIPGTTKILKADIALIAMGFAGVPRSGITDELKLELSPRGELLPSPNNMIFSCGDAKTGQSLVVRAIRSGRNEAEVIHRRLMGENVMI